jgi:hypothetical protein
MLFKELHSYSISNFPKSTKNLVFTYGFKKIKFFPFHFFENIQNPTGSINSSCKVRQVERQRKPNI